MSTKSTKARTDSRARRTMRLVGYNLLTTIVLLIPIELGLRLFQLPTPVTPPRIEFGYPKPNEMEHFRADSDLLWVYPRYAERIAAAQGTHPSIVFMGDSCTEWGRYDGALQSIIEAREPDARFTSVNVGVGGWSSWQGLQQLQRDVLPMRPKAVTIYFGWNDHWINFGFEDKHAARFIGRPSAPSRGSSGGSLLSELRTTQLVQRTILAAKGYFADHSPLRVSLADFRANLRQMVRISREHGVMPILLTAPTSHRPGREPAYLAARWVTDLEDLVPLHRRYTDAVRRVAAEEDAPLVDLHREFDQLPQPELDRIFGKDGIHFNIEGARKIAELIDRHLVRADLYWRFVGEEPRSRALEETRFKEVVKGARLLASNRVDVWLDGNRLLYVKEGRCVGSAEEPEVPFFLHVVPLHPSDLPESRKEFGYDNLDFDIADSWLRLGISHSHRCVVARRLPDYAVASIRTGQFVEGSGRLWEEEIRLF